MPLVEVNDQYTSPNTNVLFSQKGGQSFGQKAIKYLHLTETDTTTLGIHLWYKMTSDHVRLTSFTQMRVTQVRGPGIYRDVVGQE